MMLEQEDRTNVDYGFNKNFRPSLYLQRAETAYHGVVHSYPGNLVTVCTETADHPDRRCQTLFTTGLFYLFAGEKL